jgi:electron transfer flavoprotein alpha subunit
MSRSGGVCVFSERRDVSLELLTIGRTLAGDDVLISIAVGPDGEATAREQIARGASGAFVVEPDEESRRSEVQVEALRQVLAKRGPEIVLVGATAHGTEIASRLAQREEVGCASECTCWSNELAWAGSSRGRSSKRAPRSPPCSPGDSSRRSATRIEAVDSGD